MFPLDLRKHAPKYEFAFDTVDPPTYTYQDLQRNIPVFVVEQGRRFYMRFKLSAYPWPTHTDLFKDGKLVKSTSRGTIFVSADSIGVQLVDKKSYTGVYTIRSRNEMGSGEITFQITVNRKLIFELLGTTCNINCYGHDSCSHSWICPTSGRCR